jgi:hypothetical protein
MPLFPLLMMVAAASALILIVVSVRLHWRKFRGKG